MHCLSMSGDSGHCQIPYRGDDCHYNLIQGPRAPDYRNNEEYHVKITRDQFNTNASKLNFLGYFSQY
jgi:hypothetical protein